jgi:deoxyribonuclease-4
MFPSNPRSWNVPPKKLFNTDEFMELKRIHGIHPVILHAPYVINPASSNPILLAKSRKLLVSTMLFGRAIGAEYYVMHPGSYAGGTREKGIERLIESIAQLLRKTRPGPVLLLENTAGGGCLLGGKWEHLCMVVRAIDGQIGLCFDTAHAWAAGYDIRSRRGLGMMLDEIEKNGALRYIYLVHANDSASKIGSFVDRHERLGRGYIGEKGFENIVGNEILGDLPFIIETPKISARSDMAGIRFLKRLGEKYGRYKKTIRARSD